MSLRRDAIGLPLLAKELIEQAARKRTYVIRSVYALLLFSFSLLIFWGTVYSRSNSAFGILGQGRQMFFGLFMIQIIGILLFTPALTCAAVTTEKERNTFGLLLLTKLGPMTILLEKYLARVIGISSFLILSLPLFAYCYALGGIDQYSVWIAFLSLFVLMLELAALGLFCSCLFRTTVRAFIASYILGFFLLFGPLFAVEIFRIEIVWRVLWGFWFCTDVVVNVCGFAGAQVVKGVFTLVGADLDTIFRHPPDWSEFTTNFGRSNRPNEEALMLFFPVASVAESLDRTFSKPIPWRQVFAMVPPLTMTGFLLLASRLVIIRRAFVQPRHYLMLLFRKLDGFFERLNNNRWTKGKVLIDPSNRLPDNAPVAWRETSKTTLGSVQYLIRLFLAIEFPVLALCLLVVILDSGNSRRHEGLAAIYLIVALLSVLLVCVKSAMLIAGERSRETLDVLLSTPISAEELIKQKFQGVWRLIVALWIPLLTVVGSHAWVISLHNNGFFARALRDPEHSAVCNFIVQTSSIAILLPLFAWLCLLIGLWTTSATKAIFTSLAIIAAWIVLPFPILISMFELFRIQPGDFGAMLLMSSPVAVPLFSEVGELDDLTRWGPDVVVWFAVFAQIAIYGTLLVLIRSRCLRWGKRLLGRGENSPEAHQDFEKRTRAEEVLTANIWE